MQLEQGLNNVSGLATSAKQIPPQDTVTEYNIDLTSANTEYSQALSANTRAIEFTNRASNDLRFAFTTGKVAGPTAEYFTLRAGQYYYKENLNLSSKTIYFASANAGDDVELLTWE